MARFVALTRTAFGMLHNNQPPQTTMVPIRQTAALQVAARVAGEQGARDSLEHAEKHTTRLQKAHVKATPKPQVAPVAPSKKKDARARHTERKVPARHKQPRHFEE